MLSSSEYVIARSNATWQSPGTMSPMYSTRSGRRLVLGRNPGKKFLRLDSFLPQSRFSIQLQPDSRWGPGEGSGGRMAQRRGMQPDDYSNNDRLYLNASPQPTSLVLSCSATRKYITALEFTEMYTFLRHCVLLPGVLKKAPGGSSAGGENKIILCLCRRRPGPGGCSAGRFPVSQPAAAP